MFVEEEGHGCPGSHTFVADVFGVKAEDVLASACFAREAKEL